MSSALSSEAVTEKFKELCRPFEDFQEEMQENYPPFREHSLLKRRTLYLFEMIDGLVCKSGYLSGVTQSQIKTARFIYGDTLHESLLGMHVEDFNVSQDNLFGAITQELETIRTMLFQQRNDSAIDYSATELLYRFFEELLSQEHLQPLVNHLEQLKVNPLAQPSLSEKEQTDLGVKAAYFIAKFSEPLHTHYMDKDLVEDNSPAHNLDQNYDLCCQRMVYSRLQEFSTAQRRD
ncbi:MAG: hypothetical protein AAGC93_08575 [Cyanobacteria bacterium P01_F01_bin.53]